MGVASGAVGVGRSGGVGWLGAGGRLVGCWPAAGGVLAVGWRGAGGRLASYWQGAGVGRPVGCDTNS